MPEPTGYDESGRARAAVRWHIARSLRHYQALFREAATVEMSIPNIVNANYTGNISVSASLTFVSTSLAQPPPEPSAPVPSPQPLPVDETANDEAGLSGAHDDAEDDEEGAHDDASEDGEAAPAPTPAPTAPPPEFPTDPPRPAVLTTAPSRLVDVAIAALAELPPAGTNLADGL